MKAGNILLLNDGLIELEVTKVSGTRIDTKVIAGGELSNRKGVNLKGGGISAPALTDKDREDIKFACMRGVDYVAVSFPRDAADMNLARDLVRAAGGHAPPVRQGRTSRGHPQPHRDHRRVGRGHGRARRPWRGNGLRGDHRLAENHHPRIAHAQ